MSYHDEHEAEILIVGKVDNLIKEAWALANKGRNQCHYPDIILALSTRTTRLEHMISLYFRESA